MSGPLYTRARPIVKGPKGPIFSTFLPLTPVHSLLRPSAPVCSLWARLPILTSKSGELLRRLSGTPNGRSGFSGFDPGGGSDGDQPLRRRCPGRAAVAPIRRVRVEAGDQRRPRPAPTAPTAGRATPTSSTPEPCRLAGGRDRLPIPGRAEPLNYADAQATPPPRHRFAVDPPAGARAAADPTDHRHATDQPGRIGATPASPGRSRSAVWKSTG